MTNERAVELLRRLQDEQFDGQNGDERREALEMAIRAMEEPKTAGSGSVDLEQPEIKTDRTIGDSINRQQAIDAVRNAKFYFRIKPEAYLSDAGDAVNEIVCQVSEAYVKALLDLPPAERARFWIDSEGKISALPSGQIATDTNVGDMISRQQAIDALGEEPKFKQRIIKTYAEGRNDQWFDDVAKLTLIPSAQPEKTCCGYDVNELISFATACRRAGVDEKDLKTFAQDCEFAWKVMQKEISSAIREAFEKYSDISMYQDAEDTEEVIETQVGSLIFRDKVQYGIQEKLKAAYRDGYTAARKECEAERRNDETD